MAGFVEGVDRGQLSLLPGSLDDWVDESNPVRVIDAFVAALVGATVHALRRTAASEMGHLQVPPEVIERVLAHTPQGVTMKHYNRYSYAPEKLAALTKWQDELMRIVGQPSLQ